MYTATDSETPSPVRIGILGAGFMGKTHARAFAQLQDARIQGIWSRTLKETEALAAEVGAVAWPDWKTMLESPDIDAISITLPTFLHREYAVAALRAGKAVLLEKPMALTLADCDDILAAREESGSLLMMAHTLRYWPEYKAAVALAQSGSLGKVHSAVAWRHTVPPTWSPWFADASLSGGGVLDLHIHDLDLMNWLFGMPASVYSRGATGAGGGYNHAMTMLEYSDAHAFVEGSGMMPEGFPFSAYLSIRCESGVIEYTVRAASDQVDSASQGSNQLLVHSADEGTRLLLANKDFRAGDAYVEEARAFVEAVRTRTVPQEGEPLVGRDAVQVALAARDSFQQHTVICL